ncbi:MAG: helix-turn-helix transcriptional regulator [Eggerthellaceae bacterium]|nr:helix-turn-helix transcriptional regulator [Eggerthellaceae bacterium]
MERPEIRNAAAQRIKELRREQGITQEKFALMVGLNRSYLAEIEKGNRSFGIDTLDKIVMGFGLSYAEFFEKL